MFLQRRCVLLWLALWAFAGSAFGQTLSIVDASGQPVASVLQGRPLELRANAPSASGGTLSAEVTSALGGDSEVVQLTEIPPSSGQFTGSIPMSWAPAATLGDGLLTVGEAGGPPVSFDTVTAVLSCATLPCAASVSVIALPAVLRFTGLQGAADDAVFEQSWARLSADYPGANFDPARRETLSVYVDILTPESEVRDEDWFDLLETGPNTGLFAGAIRIEREATPVPWDGSLGTALNASGDRDRAHAYLYDNPSAMDTVPVLSARLQALDGTGAPISAVPFGTPFQVRLEDGHANASELAPEPAELQIEDLTFGSTVTVSAEETGPDTGVFELTLVPSASDDLPGQVQAQPGSILEISRNDNGEITSIRVNVTESPSEDPAAVDDAATTDEDTPVSVAVLANDRGSSLTVSIGIAAAHGSTVVQADGTILYSPALNFNGTDSFSYTITDGQGTAASALVALTIQPVNDPPVARNTVMRIDEDTQGSFQILNGPYETSDVDGDTLAAVAVTQPAHGTAAFAPGQVTYTPAADYCCNDSFTYTVSDGHGGTATGTVSVEIRPIDDPPVARDDAFTIAEDFGERLDLLANDSDPEGAVFLNLDNREYHSAHGTYYASFNDLGKIDYYPNPDFNGTDTFTYSITDGTHQATATVTITVTPVNDPPIGTADRFTTLEDTPSTLPVLTNDTDVDGDALSVSRITQPAHGTAVINANGTVTYTPAANYNGADFFNYYAADGAGAESFPTRVDLTVTAVQDPPVARDDVLTVQEDTPTTLSVTANDSDPDSDLLAVQSVTQPAHGTLTLSGSLTYTPALNYNGPDAFTYTIHDFHGNTATASVSLTVTPVNDRPVAVQDNPTTLEDTPVTIAVLANDSDVEGDTLTITGFLQGLHGAATLNADGTVTYTPALNYNGIDTFVYNLSDGHGGTASGLVRVTLTPVNDPPVANANSATTNEDTAVAINVTANDSDVDGDTLSVASVTPPAHGTATFTGGTITYTPAADYNGSDSFTYTVSDGQGGTATAAVSVTINSVNDPPRAVDDNVTTPEDTAIQINVLSNDTDDGSGTQVLSVGTPAHGTAFKNVSTGNITYTPSANYYGPDSFTYTIRDLGNLTATATVYVTVTSVNDLPVAVSDSASTAEDTPVTINVLANDSDPEGDALSVAGASQGLHGSTQVNADNTITYTPALNYYNSDSFTYTLRDANGGTRTGTVNVTISPVNDPPVAVDDTAVTAEDTAKTISVRTNDSDPELDTLTLTGVTQPAHGTATFTTASVTYTPAANYNGADAFTYTISDGKGGTASATVSITVTPVNDAPSAGADAATTNEDTAAAFNVLANDTDPDGDSLAVTAVTQPAHGSATFTASGVTYTPAANYNGADSFTYTVSDGHAGNATGTVSVTVTAVNDAPSAGTDAATTNEDTAKTIPVLTNDSDLDGDSLAVTAVTQPAHGSTAFTASSVTYTPAANYNGSDSFTYTISDGHGGSATGTVNVTVTAVNDPPAAGTDSTTTNEDAAVAISVLTNDSDTDGDSLTVTAVTQPAHGSTTFTASGVTYTPAANYNGADSFTYTISDGNGGNATGTVNVTVTAVNDPPSTGADSATTPEDTAKSIPVLTNDSDPDGDSLTVTAVTQPAHGSTTFTASGVTYTPAANYNGPDSFTYTISDGNGGNATGTVNVTITAVNDPPSAGADSTTTNEDAAVTVSVLTNDSDPDGDSLTVTAVTQPAHGSATFTVSGVTYTPAANYNGTDSFTYTISDGNGGSATGTVSVTITAVNDAPSAGADTATTAEDTAQSISVLTNDSDLDGDTLAVTAVTQPAHGSATFTASGITYTPAANYNGADSFTYTISDGNGGTAIGTVSISVTAVNDPPAAISDSGTTREGVAATVSVLTNDSDIEGNPLTVIGVSTPAHGAASFNSSSVTYTPAANFNGVDTFTYTVSDGAATNTATVTITVKDALERVAVLATNSAWIQTGADVLSGDVVVNQAGAGPFLNGAELSLAGTVTTPSGWDLDADSLTIAAGTTVASDVFFNQLTSSGTITGQQTATLTLPVFASLPAFLSATPSTTDVNVSANGTRTLAPGNYRDLIVGKKGTVIFSGGTYHFRSITTDTQAKLLFSAASTVRVQQKMSVKATGTVGPNTGATINASAIVVYVEGINGTGGGLAETPKAVEIGTDNTLTANLYAPNGTLWIADRTQARGSFFGKDVQIGPDVQVTLQSAWSGQ